ncbi:MAG: CRTAC1 family protein [Acidobacteria bacterium]|nr:MAG: CRTAC1 family protein [Acidobacteriota bacterium]
MRGERRSEVLRRGIGVRLAVKTTALALATAISATDAPGQGVATGSGLRPGVKAIKCKGRAIPQLEDITQETGIHFTHSSAPENRYIVESMSGGVLVVDYDRDGWPDIYFTNAPTVEMALRGETAPGALYHNNRDGTFTDLTARSGMKTPCFGMGGAVGDYDNDGWPDIYLTCLGGNVLYHNNGDGTFTDVTEKTGVRDGRWSTGAAFADYDGHGFLDLMVANYVDLDLKHLPVFGSGATCKFMGIDVQCGPRGLKGAGDSLFHNNGDGTFTDVSKKAGVDDQRGFYGLTVVWADFNNMGRPDIYVANDSTASYLYRNEGNGKFAEIGLDSGTGLGEDGHEMAGMGVAIGDYLHTGRPSLLVTNFALDNSPLFRNDGKWNFEDVSYPSGVALPSVPWVKWGDAFVDLDNDGWLDLITVNGHVYPQVDTLPSGARYREPKLVHFNQRDGTFCDASDQAGSAILEPRVSRGLAVGDLFNDGNMDVVVEDLEGSPMILRNHGITGRHWVSFELAGTKSNRLAIGAKVKIVAGGMTQTEEIHSGGSYLSQNDSRVHFGLGGATTITSVEIHWPSGAVERLKDLRADQFYAVLEGKGRVAAEEIEPRAKNARKN